MKSDRTTVQGLSSLGAKGVLAENRRKTEAILFLLLGIAFLAVSSPRIHLTLLNAAHHSDLWKKRSAAVVQLGLFYGLACLFLATLSFVFARRDQSLTRRAWYYFAPVPGAVWNKTSDLLRKGFVPQKGGVFLAIAVLVGIAIRACFLRSPMKWDESFNFFTNIQSPWPFVFEYTAPNNHVLNSIFERISTLILGQNPIAIRLPAFLSGVASIPLAFQVCRTHRPGASGYFAAIAVAIWPFLVFYSANGRGYSLMVLLTLLLIWIGLNYVNRPTRAGVGLLAITSALGLFTLPSMLFMVVGAGVWIAGLLLANGWTRKSVLLEFTLPFGGLAISLTALLYTPVVLVTGGFEFILRNRFVRPQPWGDFFRQLGPHLRDSASALTSGIPRFAVVTVVVLVVAGFYASFRRRDWPTLMLLPLVLGSSALGLIVQHRIPFERTWIYVLPLILLVADAGFAGLLEMTTPKVRSMAIAVLYCGALILGTRFVASSPAQRHAMGEDFPEARVAAQFLKPILMEGDAVRTSLTAEQPTFFYLWYDTSVVNPRTRKTLKPRIMFYLGDQEFHYSFMSYDDRGNPRVPVTTEPMRVFYVVKKSECALDTSPDIHIFLQDNATLDLPANRFVKLLDYQDMAIYRQLNSSN